jgi:hypothetical protein
MNQLSDLWWCITHPTRDLDIYLINAYSHNKKKNINARKKIENECPLLLDLIAEHNIIELKNSENKTVFYIDFNNILFYLKNSKFHCSSFIIHNKKSRKRDQLFIYGYFGRNNHISWKCRINKTTGGYIATLKIDRYPLHKMKYNISI